MQKKKKKPYALDQGGEAIDKLLRSLSKRELEKVAPGLLEIDRRQMRGGKKK